MRSDDRIEDVELETDSRSERRNLPEEVEPGVTYRNVEVGWAARARAVMPEGHDDDQDEERRTDEGLHHPRDRGPPRRRAAGAPRAIGAAAVAGSVTAIVTYRLLRQ